MKRRAWATLVVVPAVTLAMVPSAVSASPLPALTAVSTTTQAAAEGSTPLAGLRVTDRNPSQVLEVTVSTDVGSLTLAQHAGLSLAFANSWSGDASVTFAGVAADARAGLASVSLVTGSGDAGSSAHVAVSAHASQPGYVYSSSNQHFYEYVADPEINWNDAATAAALRTFDGQQGYLATVPDQEVNDLVANRIEDAFNVWIGAFDVETPGEPVQRTWQWAGGPLAGHVIATCSTWADTCDDVQPTGAFQAWAETEPNNVNALPGVPHSGEWAAVTNWNGGVGEWNDLPATQSPSISGYVVEYGDRPVGATSFTGVVTDTSTVSVLAAAQPQGLAARGGDRTVSVSWTPAQAGAVHAYSLSIDGGRSWRTVLATSGGSLRTVVAPVRNGLAYRVVARALGSAGQVLASSAMTTPVAQWFHDPVPAASRAAEIAVPARLRSYLGPRKHTVRTGRAHGGTPAFPALALNGRKLQSGQAAAFAAGSMFAFDSTRLRPRGRAQLRAMVPSLHYVSAVTCEGYADYGGRVRVEKRLASGRAAVVCRILKTFGATVTTRTRGYGSAEPVVVGGTRAQRAANRRVVVLVTRG